jgi:hypothetical protein
MAYVKISSLNPRTKKGRAAAGKGIKVKVLRDERGKIVRVFSIDTNSEALGSKLRYTFGRSVAKARRENKKKFGAPDRVLVQR